MNEKGIETFEGNPDLYADVRLVSQWIANKTKGKVFYIQWEDLFLHLKTSKIVQKRAPAKSGPLVQKWVFHGFQL